MMQVEVLFFLLLASFGGGIAAARVSAERRRRRLVRLRLAQILFGEKPATAEPQSLIKQPRVSRLERALTALPGGIRLRRLLDGAGSGEKIRQFWAASLGLLLFPPAVAFACDWNPVIAAVVGAVLSVCPLAVVATKACRRRTRFSEQLPDAIDLMVSVLRSGHSIPHAVKAVAEEIPSPCGAEFAAVLKRMNLGQPLSQALYYSSERFGSYELDLIRRAVSIQAEVGGSLAELLEKTNSTLRQRLKLVRQVRVLTAQSRLTAIIVGLMPLLLAAALEFMSPHYLSPLFSSGFGRILLAAAVCLQLVGVYLMKRMSTVRV